MDQQSKRDIVKNTLNEIDKNQDGYICYDEFKAFVAKVRRSQIMSTQHSSFELLKGIHLLAQSQKRCPESRHERVMDYFHIIGHGRVISKWPPPFFIISVTIVQIILFLLFTYTNLVDDLFETLEFNPSKRGEVWRYLSYCLVHQNWEHIIINTVLQLLVGLLLEVIHKWKRVAPIYIIGVLTASLGYCIVDHYSLIGASGGIYCLIAACVPDIIVNWKESRAVFIQRYRTGHVAHACDGKLLRVLRLFAVVAFAVFDIGYNLVHSTENDGVSVWAHGFGCLAGVMFGLVLLKDSREEVGH
jgi:rhomboid-related protein 1/2/3